MRGCMCGVGGGREMFWRKYFYNEYDMDEIEKLQEIENHKDSEYGLEESYLS